MSKLNCLNCRHGRFEDYGATFYCNHTGNRVNNYKGTVCSHYISSTANTSEPEKVEKVELVNHPMYYGGEDDPYEAIKVIEAWDLGFCLGNAVKYISRAGKKDPLKTVEDLEKAKWYIERRIKEISNE